MIPNVLGYALAFGFFKFVNYAMFFWLPYFLSLHFDPQSANVISSLYSVGMMPGGVIVGFVSDLYDGRRACVIATFMLLLAPLLWVFAMFSDAMNPVLLLVLLGVMGILVGGPNNIITSAVAADLADHPSIGGNTRVLGTVTGIINGSGSITAALGLMLIGAWHAPAQRGRGRRGLVVTWAAIPPPLHRQPRSPQLRSRRPVGGRRCGISLSPASPWAPPSWAPRSGRRSPSTRDPTRPPSPQATRASRRQTPRRRRRRRRGNGASDGLQRRGVWFGGERGMGSASFRTACMRCSPRQGLRQLPAPPCPGGGAVEGPHRSNAPPRVPPPDAGVGWPRERASVRISL